MGKTVNQRELAEIIGVSDVTLWEWEKTGLPILRKGEKGQPNEYDTEAVIAWRVEREVARRAPAKTREERERVELELAQLKLGQITGTLVPAAEVEPVWTNRVLTAAAFMAGRHSRLAAILEATAGVEAKRELLKREDAEFLKKLGADGERMQAVVDELMASFATDKAQEILRRIAGDDTPPTTEVDPGPGVEGDGSAGKDPAV